MSEGVMLLVDSIETLITEVRGLRGDLQRRERGALNAKEAAAFLGVSDRTLHKLVRAGRIRQTRVSKARRMYRWGELERYLTDQEQELSEGTDEDQNWLSEATGSRNARG